MKGVQSDRKKKKILRKSVFMEMENCSAVRKTSHVSDPAFLESPVVYFVHVRKNQRAALSAHEDTMEPEELERGGGVVVVREAKKGVCVGGQEGARIVRKGVKYRTENLTSEITRPLFRHFKMNKLIILIGKIESFHVM